MLVVNGMDIDFCGKDGSYAYLICESAWEKENARNKNKYKIKEGDPCNIEDIAKLDREAKENGYKVVVRVTTDSADIIVDIVPKDVQGPDVDYEGYFDNLLKNEVAQYEFSVVISNEDISNCIANRIKNALAH